MSIDDLSTDFDWKTATKCWNEAAKWFRWKRVPSTTRGRRGLAVGLLDAIDRVDEQYVQYLGERRKDAKVHLRWDKLVAESGVDAALMVLEPCLGEEAVSTIACHGEEEARTIFQVRMARTALKHLRSVVGTQRPGMSPVVEAVAWSFMALGYVADDSAKLKPRMLALLGKRRNTKNAARQSSISKRETLDPICHDLYREADALYRKNPALKSNRSLAAVLAKTFPPRQAPHAGNHQEWIRKLLNRRPKADRPWSPGNDASRKRATNSAHHPTRTRQS